MSLKNVDGRFMFNDDVSVNDIVNQFGCPVYVYDAQIIKRQYNRMLRGFNVKHLKINYACKALSNINVLRYMRSLGAGLDTVSIQEVHLGLEAGFRPEEIIFTPNCVSLDEIEQAVQLGVKINIDNLSVLEEFGHQYSSYPVCVRINPHIMAGGNSKISTGHIDSKFGISFHQFPHIQRIAEATGLQINGLHMHTGSDILDSEVFLAGAEILFNLALELPDLTYLDFGSGFKVSYKEDGIETDIEDLGLKISERFTTFCTKYGRDITLMFEPGKYLVSQSGYFFVKANVVKQTTANVFVGVDSGFNHLIRPMMYDAFHRISNVSKSEGKKRIYTVVGYICETDTFGVNRKLTEVSEGDILCIHNAGAYCMSMASNYNSRFMPAEVLLLNNKMHLIRKRDTLSDILRNQVEIPELTEPITVS